VQVIRPLSVTTKLVDRRTCLSASDAGTDGDFNMMGTSAMTLEECADMTKSVGQEHFMFLERGYITVDGNDVAVNGICKLCSAVSDLYFDAASAEVNESVYRV